MYATNNYLVLRTIDPPSETAGGILIPEQSRERPQWGWVVDVGEGLPDINGIAVKPDFEVGNLVYFMKHAPENLDLKDKDPSLHNLCFVSEGDIYVKVKKTAEGKPAIFPMGNYIHIEPLEDSVQKTTAGGIILPQQAIERPSLGRVISVGPGQRTISGKFYSPLVNPGDTVRYRPFSPFIIRFDDLGMEGAKQMIVAYGDIVAVESQQALEHLKKVVDGLPRLKEGDSNNGSTK